MLYHIALNAREGMDMTSCSLQVAQSVWDTRMHQRGGGVSTFQPYKPSSARDVAKHAAHHQEDNQVGYHAASGRDL
eukprot:758942-Hanusia_phi.AAC.2